MRMSNREGVASRWKDKLRIFIIVCLFLCGQAASIIGNNSTDISTKSIDGGDKLAAPPTTPMPVPVPVPVTTKFWPSFLTALSMILVSELGDKTFLIAAIMSMRHPRPLIFSASLLALALMTIISAAFGLLLPRLFSRELTRWLAALLFLLFGLRMLWEGAKMSSTHMRDEYEEVTHEIEDGDDCSGNRRSQHRLSRLEMGGTVEEQPGEEALSLAPGFFGNLWKRGQGLIRLEQVTSPVFAQTFSLTFLAEWGDRSQIATIALAAAQNVWAVTLGAILGHAICTALAVLSGKLLSNILSIRTGKPSPFFFASIYLVTIGGGLLFILFAALSLL